MKTDQQSVGRKSGKRFNEPTSSALRSGEYGQPLNRPGSAGYAASQSTRGAARVGQVYRPPSTAISAHKPAWCGLKALAIIAYPHPRVIGRYPWFAT